jgi:hypothetical protein
MRIFILLLVILGVAPPLTSQRVVRVPSTVTCDACRIVLEPIARLGSADEPLSLISIARVVSDSRGHYYVAPTFEAGLIAHYRRDGRFLGTIGRAGQGPGEFQRINGLVMAAGDTLHVFEGVRYTRLDAASGAFIGSANLPFPPRGRFYCPRPRDGDPVHGRPRGTGRRAPAPGQRGRGGGAFLRRGRQAARPGAELRIGSRDRNRSGRTPLVGEDQRIPARTLANGRLARADRDPRRIVVPAVDRTRRGSAVHATSQADGERREGGCRRAPVGDHHRRRARLAPAPGTR